MRAAPAAAAAAAALVCAALALGGCSFARSDTATTSTEPPPVRAGTIERTRVDVIERGASKLGFDAAAIYRLYSPGVVTIIATFPSANQAALGSGFTVDGAGYIATNAHVILDQAKLSPARSVYVAFADGNRVPAQIVGYDLNADLALLKVNPAGLTLTPLRLGSSARLVVGSPVEAIGSPFGEEQSLSVGVISATGRDIESLTAFRIGNAIQTDAAINRGNSGGPLIGAGGEVVGVNSQIQSSSGGGEGVGFAIPIDTVRRSLDQLRRTHHVAYAFLGVTTEDLYPQLAARLRFMSSRGALVATVTGGGPAAKAGIVAGHDKIDFESQKGIPVGGDAIVAVDGSPIRRSADLSNIIGLRDPGQRVTLTVERGARTRQVQVVLAPRPNLPGPSSG